MGVIKKGGKTVAFDDTTSGLGVNNMGDAVRELDRRLDILEAYFNNGGTPPSNPSTIGWKDNIMPFTSMKLFVNSEPLWADIGNGIFAYHFEDARPKEVFAYFHINHDYAPGTKIYPHIHWMPDSTIIGDVKWDLEIVKAKGHGQGDSLKDPVTLITIIGTSQGIDGEHLVSEVSDTDAFIVDEPDTVLLIRIKRDTYSPLDTLPGHAIGLLVDLHYQSDRDFTPGKTPDTFYTGA